MASDVAGPGPGSIARAKDRQPGQIRRLSCRRNVLQRADGSASWAQDGSVVLAAVHGPLQAPPRREDAERAVLEVVVKPWSGLAGAAEQEQQEVLRRTLEAVVVAALHPRTQITLALQVVQADGSLPSCALNAAMAALVDAGVPLSKMLASVTCAFTQQGVLLLDPDAAEEKAAAAVFCFVFAHRHVLEADGSRRLDAESGVVTCHSRGRFSAPQLLQALEACRAGCEGVAEFVELLLLRSFKESLQQAG